MSSRPIQPPTSPRTLSQLKIRLGQLEGGVKVQKKSSIPSELIQSLQKALEWFFDLLSNGGKAKKMDRSVSVVSSEGYQDKIDEAFSRYDKDLAKGTRQISQLLQTLSALTKTAQVEARFAPKKREKADAYQDLQKEFINGIGTVVGESYRNGKGDYQTTAAILVLRNAVHQVSEGAGEDFDRDLLRIVDLPQLQEEFVDLFAKQAKAVRTLPLETAYGEAGKSQANKLIAEQEKLAALDSFAEVMPDVSAKISVTAKAWSDKALEQKQALVDIKAFRSLVATDIAEDPEIASLQADFKRGKEQLRTALLEPSAKLSTMGLEKRGLFKNDALLSAIFEVGRGGKLSFLVDPKMKADLEKRLEGKLSPEMREILETVQMQMAKAQAVGSIGTELREARAVRSKLQERVAELDEHLIQAEAFRGKLEAASLISTSLGQAS